MWTKCSLPGNSQNEMHRHTRSKRSGYLRVRGPKPPGSGGSSGLRRGGYEWLPLLIKPCALRHAAGCILRDTMKSASPAAGCSGMSRARREAWDRASGKWGGVPQSGIDGSFILAIDRGGLTGFYCSRSSADESSKTGGGGLFRGGGHAK